MFSHLGLLKQTTLSLVKSGPERNVAANKLFWCFWRSLYSTNRLKTRPFGHFTLKELAKTHTSTGLCINSSYKTVSFYMMLPSGSGWKKIKNTLESAKSRTEAIYQENIWGKKDVRRKVFCCRTIEINLCFMPCDSHQNSWPRRNTCNYSIYTALLGTPVHPRIHTIIQSDNHVSWAQFIKSGRYRPWALANLQNGRKCDLSEFDCTMGVDASWRLEKDQAYVFLSSTVRFL